jgi:hypothetical protein
LYRRLETAKEKEDEQAERQILTIIQQEKDRSFWWRLNYAIGNSRGGACFKVQVEQVEGTLGWEIQSEFCGIPRLFRFWTFWTPEFSSEFYFSHRKMCSRQF